MIDITLENVDATVIKESMHREIKDQINLSGNPVIQEFSSRSIFNIRLLQDQRGSIIDTKHRYGSLSTSAVREIVFDVVKDGERTIKFKTHNSYYLIIVHEQ